jgi:ABC-type phosphate transport system permease subunit
MHLGAIVRGMGFILGCVLLVILALILVLIVAVCAPVYLIERKLRRLYRSFISTGLL